MALLQISEPGQSPNPHQRRIAVGIDLGTTHSLVAAVRSGVAECLPDAQGRVLLRLTRPAKVMKSTVIVSDGNDQEIGRIVQDNVFGKIHFTLQAGGHTYGSINAENWRAWNFRIDDHTGQEVARITKTFEGIAKTLFTTADNYVVQIHGQIPQPLNTLVVAAALSVDTALKQDSRGFG